MTVFAAAYVSTATVPFSDKDLAGLLLTARHHNGVHGITGKLYAVEKDGAVVQFVQWIEGESDAVRACLDRIHADARHTDLRIQFFGPTERRRFPNWDMDIQTIPPDAMDAAVLDVTPQAGTAPSLADSENGA